MATVLILDGLQRKSLALTRWLGMEGHRVLTAESTFFSICRFSRFAARSFVYPNPQEHPAEFIRWLGQVVARESVQAVLPTDDITTACLTAHHREIRTGTGLLLPPHSSFDAMLDKARSVDWFARARIPHPRTVVVQHPGDVLPAARSLGLPLVIKPRVSSGSRGLRFVHRLEDVERLYSQVHSHYPWPILQQYITPGPKYHACLLYDRDGQVVARYTQRELRQYPIGGGPSTMQECVHRPDLTEMLERLFTELPWTGPVHADIMEDGRTGQPYVLEVNPRYWQSLHVAHRAGYPFARLHLALAMGERPSPLPPARVGIRGRALLPFDLLAYISDPHRSGWDPPFFSRYGPHTWDDLLSLSDPGPTVGFCLAVSRYLFDRTMWQAVLRLETRTTR